MTTFVIWLHVLIAIFFAVHAIRSRQQIPWLLILFVIPLLGALLYYVGIYLPSWRRERHDRKVAAEGAAKAIDPVRALRDAQAAFDFAPSAHNQVRLANAQLLAGDAEAAAATYGACLQGVFANDPEIRLGAARASIACGRHAEAIAAIERLRHTDPDFRAEQASLLLARALAGVGRTGEARAAFEAAVKRHGSFETKAEFAIWAAGAREFQLAHRLQNELRSTMDRWNRHTHAMNLPLVRRLEAAFAEVPPQH